MKRKVGLTLYPRVLLGAIEQETLYSLLHEGAGEHLSYFP